MLRLPKKMMFALEAVVDIAYNARPEPVQSKEITRRQGIPQRYLEQVMQQLVHGGILKGVRGPRGGYTLARERRRISVADVIRVIGDAQEAAKEKEEREQGSEIGRKIVHPLLDEIQADLIRRLEEVSLEDLCRKAAEMKLEQEGRETADFNI